MLLEASALILNVFFILVEGTKLHDTFESVSSDKDLEAVPPIDFTLANALPTDINYYLYTSKNQNNWTVLTTDSVSREEFDRNLPTKLLIHGFTTDETSPWYPIVKREYFKRGPHNIIYIDWSRAGNLTYAVSSANVDSVGEFMADFLIASKIPAGKIHLIAHSLGSHLAGFIGKHYFKKSTKKIGRVTSLDTAGPAFHKHPETLRLCHSDAEFVDAIHTDDGHYGYSLPHGHVDFYPNFGKSQPGCKHNTEDENCSHARSTIFFAESINHRTKEAMRVNYTITEEIIVIGGGGGRGETNAFGDGVGTDSRGQYYLRTNSKPPYLTSQ